MNISRNKIAKFSLFNKKIQNWTIKISKLNKSLKKLKEIWNFKLWKLKKFYKN